MKFIIVFVALFAVALAAPPLQQKETVILRADTDVQPDGFRYNWETSDGSSAQAEGQLKNIGREDESIAVRGSFSFVADDGVLYTINYIADENGYQPQGAHLPVAPVA